MAIWYEKIGDFVLVITTTTNGSTTSFTITPPSVDEQVSPKPLRSLEK